MEKSSKIKTTELLDLVDVKFMQNTQDFFAKTLNVALLTVYENNWLTDSSNTIEFCRKYIRRSEIGNSRCNNCHLEWEKIAIQEGKPVIFNCHIGLTNFAIPIVVEGKYMACVIGGQVLTEPLTEEHFMKVAKDLEIDEDEYIKEIRNIRVSSIEKIKAITELLYLIANSIATIAHINTQLKELGINYRVPRNIALEEWFLNNYGNIKRPISSREFEVLKGIVQGKSNTEIAKELFISAHTVKAHVSSIIEKFEVEDRIQVAVKAVREGLV